MQKIKILMINNHIHFGGGGDAAFRHERRIYEEEGYEVYTFSFASTLPGEKSKNDYICLVSNNNRTKKFNKFVSGCFIARELRAFIKTINPALVHIHLVSEFPISVYSAVSGYPVLHTLHGPNLFCATSWGCIKKNGAECEMGVGIKCYTNDCVPIAELPLHYELAKRTKYWCNKNITVYICPSRQIERSAKALGYMPTIYLPLAIDREFNDVEIIEPDGKKSILYVGALVEQKGLEYLIKAFKKVKNEVKDVRLNIAGRGELKDNLVILARELGVDKDVQFLGFQNRESVLELYRTSTVLAMPSIWKEQFGLVGPEALACGLPVVASDIGGIPEWLHDAKWGYLVEPRNEDQLADKLIRVISNPQLQRKMGKAGREFVLKEFSPEKYKNNLLRVVTKYMN